MKKTIFALIAVLLLVLMATCEDYGPQTGTDPDDSLPLYTEDGRKMVHLTISRPVNQDRALTEALAKGGVDYYEVAFKDPNWDLPASGDNNRIYRASWDYTITGRIAVPPGDYYGADKAILFAGRYSDRTLLAAGVLTSIQSTPLTAANAVIEPNTTTVTFTMKWLENDIVADRDDSTFKITGPLGPPDYRTQSIPVGFPVGEIEGIFYPVFRIPRQTGTGISATYKVIIPAITTVVAPATTANTDIGIMIKQSGRLLSSGTFYNEDPGVTVTGTISPITGDLSTVPAAGFGITISTAGLENGLSRLSIEVPVCAINETLDAPGTWYVRGGMSQNILDAGVARNSLGGAVLLAVGAVKINGIDINTTWPLP